MTGVFEEAEWNDDGELIYEKPVATGPNSTDTVDVNVGTLLTPGTRRTRDMNILLLEARHIEDPDKSVGNPARPANSDMAKAAIERIESEGLKPAWRAKEPEVFPRRE